MLSKRRSPWTLGLVVASSIVLVAVVLLQAVGAAGSNGPIARDWYAVFTQGPAASVEPELSSLAEEVKQDATDKTHFRVLGAGLGSYHSRLVAFPAQSGVEICYALLGAQKTDPGMSYCYPPGDPTAPAGLNGQRFHAVALQSVVDGQLDTQVFGLAQDSVTRVRISVAGTWHDAPIKRNGFYLDLPDVPHLDVGLVEATLRDGSTQVEDIQTGR
jgi:hypothetical protein